MCIIEAKYGDVDVKHIVEKYVKYNNIFLRVDNNTFGFDPSVGVIKYLYVKLKIYDEIKEFKIKEHDYFVITDYNTKKLGIFYSNNIDPKLNPSIYQSLLSIEKAAKNKAEIITNFWFPFKDNPFIETISWTKTSSHLNQVLQILQCLYTAKVYNKYLYVSFLEHDVMYPEGYFDYDDFESECIVNLNYIGINKNGFQKHIMNQRPLSQMTMRMDYAIDHFYSLLPNTILTNSAIVEPQIKIKTWNCKNPSVHINHGKHFTSHFCTYSKETTEYNEYWGDHKQYDNLFF